MIELKNIKKDYITGNNTVHALKGVSLAFRENEFVAILGPSGGGKTTLLNIIGGLDRYSSGDLIINGKSTVKYKDRDWDTYRNHSVGFVFQSYNLIPHQTVLSNVELALTIAGVSKKERRERAKAVLEKVGLGDQLNKKPNQLSGGQMQRVAIARALINNPDILLADEPTGALDSKTSVQIMDLLKEVALDRLVVMVTHNPELAQEYANRVIRISDGEIIGDTNPYKEKPSKNKENKKGKAKMKITTALSLSLQNLWTKKGRTVLVGFAGSIGIIGIALILSLSTGVNAYIDEVQENSLSSYPLSIENSTVDFSSVITSMMGTISAKEEIEGIVSEVPAMTEMFSAVRVGENNLKNFKKYLEENKETIAPWVSSLKYAYGISPQIFKSDTSNGVVKLNPSELMSNPALSMYSQYSFGDTFSEIMENQKLLDAQYDVVAGKWPTNYDEVILVLSDKYAVSDFMLYSLGIRDSKEFQEIIMALMKGETPEVKHDKLQMTYEELLNLNFKLVLSKDYYQYDEKYNVWQDMSDNEEYLKGLVDNGLTLRVVGVVAPKKGVASAAIQQGIGYKHSLIEWIIAQAKESEIVKAQLANKDVDVFSGRTFQDINNGQAAPSINFQDMISIDEEKIKESFGSIDQKEIADMVAENITQAMNDIVINDDAVIAELKEDIINQLTDALKTYLNEHEIFGVATLNAADIDGMVEKQLDKVDFDHYNNVYGIKKIYLEPFYKGILQGALQGYIPFATALQIDKENVLVTKLNISLYTVIFATNEQFIDGVSMFATSICEGVIKEKVALRMSNMTSELVIKISSALNVDPIKLASAFQFNMSQEDLTRLMTTLSTKKTLANMDANIRKLGYRDLDDPTRIAVYLIDFASKDSFKEFVSDYNKQMESINRSEDVINYTDITGILMSSIQTIINAISYILIAFVSVSLVVSSIMIAIITYISVIERTKEIGILRSLGASKRDVGNIFSAETFIIGLLAGLFGVGTTLLLLIPINFVINSLTGIASLRAQLPPNSGLALVIISVVLTLIAGVYPSRKASKCDPVIALRSE